MMENLYKMFETLSLGYIQYEQNKIRIIIDRNDEVWFNATDIAKSLEYKKLNETVRKLIDNDDKTQLRYLNHNYDVSGIHPFSIYTSEAGLYTLIISSRLPSAKKFKRWITHEVIPSIRKYGYYQAKTEFEHKLSKSNKKYRHSRKEKYRINESCKKRTYPKGSVVYALDYSNKYSKIYRIGMTKNMAERIKIYNTRKYYINNVVNLTALLI